MGLSAAFHPLFSALFAMIRLAMLRLFFLPVLFFVVCLSAFAQTNSETKIDNGIAAVVWNEAENTIEISQSGKIFAKIEYPKGYTANLLSDEFNGNTLVLSGDNFSKVFFVLFERVPFVFMNAHLSEHNFTDGPIKKFELPPIELQMSAEENMTLGTAGLRTVDGHKGSYMFLAIANPKNRSGVVTGWTTNKKGSGIIFSEKDSSGQAVIKPVLEYGKLLLVAMETEWFAIGWFDDCRYGLERYAQWISDAHKIRLKDIPAGYCTWYADGGFGGACNEKDIITLTDIAFEKLAPFGFNFVQIDDKWQDGERLHGPARGFRRVHPKGPYPNGMMPVANHVRSKNMMAGIWLLPFAGTPEESDVDHSLYVKSGVTDEVNARGGPVRPNKMWANKEGLPYQSRWTGATLDMTNPAAQEYLHKTIEQMAKDWNFNYFKLDGFNAALGVENVYYTVNGEYRPDDFGEAVYHNPEITPVAAHRLGLETIRKAAGEDAFILGCNISQNMRSMGASYGLVDAMRIGPDNGAEWKRLLQGPWHGTNRYFYNGRVWWNDPDPVYVKNVIPLEHARLIATWVSVSGQLFVFSDWIPRLSEERLDILRRTMRPHGLTSVRPVDFFNENFPKIWHLTNRSDDKQVQFEQDIVAIYNWDDETPLKIETTAQWLGLPEAEEYVAFDYWGNRFFGSFRNALSLEVPAGSCLVLAVQPVKPEPVLLSTSQHVTQGIVDVVNVSWDADKKTLSGVSKVIANDTYELRIYNPATKSIRLVTFQPEESSDSFEWNVSF